MTLAIFILVLIFGFGLYFLIAPMLSRESFESGPEEAVGEDLRYRKREVLESLQEFDLDRQMKKISEQDYDTLYQETFAEGTKILKQIDQREIETKRAPASRFCSQCGASLEPQAKFCSQCGKMIQKGFS